jgi:hypothetical protein
MPRQPLDLKSLPRPDRQRYAECAADGCRGHPRSFSRYCTMHARRFHHTRDPNGRAVRLSEVRPYTALAEEFLGRNASHPAVVAAVELIRATLTDTTLPTAVRRQLTRLRVDGASPQDMLVAFLGVWGLGHFLPHSVATDACRDFNYGNRSLRATPVPSFTATSTGKRQPTRIPPRVAEAFGAFLRERLGVFATQFWVRVERELEAPQRAAAALAEACRTYPLDSY